MIELHLHINEMRIHIKHNQQVRLETETQRIYGRRRREEEKKTADETRKSLDIHDRIYANHSTIAISLWLYRRIQYINLLTNFNGLYPIN